jgi:hypothetical protein
MLKFSPLNSGLPSQLAQWTHSYNPGQKSLVHLVDIAQPLLNF